MLEAYHMANRRALGLPRFIPSTRGKWKFRLFVLNSEAEHFGSRWPSLSYILGFEDDGEVRLGRGEYSTIFAYVL
jgi:hypothetical protein